MQQNFKQLFKWSYSLGMALKEQDSKYTERLIFDLRGETTHGRFFEKLSIRIADFNKRLNNFQYSIPSQIFEHKTSGDAFYYLKSVVLTGLINSLSSNK